MTAGIKRTTTVDGITQWVRYDTPMINGEQLTVELTLCKVHDPKDKNTIPFQWFKHGYTDKFLQSFWDVRTYVKGEDGSSPRLYNPTLKLKQQPTEAIINGVHTEYYGHEINFDWILEGTEANRLKLLQEIERMAFGDFANITDGTCHV